MLIISGTKLMYYTLFSDDFCAFIHMHTYQSTKTCADIHGKFSYWFIFYIFNFFFFMILSNAWPMLIILLVRGMALKLLKIMVCYVHKCKETSVFICSCGLMGPLINFQTRESIHQLREKFGNFYLVAMIPRVHLRKDIR